MIARLRAPDRRTADDGGSLAELLVAMGLFTLLTLVITVTSVLGYRISANLANRTDNATQGQLATDAVSKVLRTAILPDQLTEVSCVDCADTAIVQATRTQVSFYANLGATSVVGPSLVTLRVVQDTRATQTSGQLVQTLQPPTDLGGGKYTFCNPATAGCAVQTRVLTRGLAWPAVSFLAYYNFSGTEITSATFSSADLASVASVEVNLAIQVVKGQARYPATTVIKRVRLPNSDINVLVQPSP
jgi:hypothetical protein